MIFALNGSQQDAFLNRTYRTTENVSLVGSFLRKNPRPCEKILSEGISLMSYYRGIYDRPPINPENSMTEKLFYASCSRLFRSCCKLIHILKICVYYYFCDSRNISEVSRFQLFFSNIFVVILKNADILFGNEYKREM